MEYSEIILIAFILLVVFTTVQLKEFIDFIKGAQSVQAKDAVPPKTVLKTTDYLDISQEEVLPKQGKKDEKKPVVKKTLTSAKTPTKKKTVKVATPTKAKKTSVKKKTVELPKRTKTKKKATK